MSSQTQTKFYNQNFTTLNHFFLCNSIEFSPPLDSDHPKNPSRVESDPFPFLAAPTSSQLPESPATLVQTRLRKKCTSTPTVMALEGSRMLRFRPTAFDSDSDGARRKPGASIPPYRLQLRRWWRDPTPCRLRFCSLRRWWCWERKKKIQRLRKKKGREKKKMKRKRWKEKI